MSLLRAVEHGQGEAVLILSVYRRPSFTRASGASRTLPNIPARWLEATVWEDVRHFLREPSDVLERMRRQHDAADDPGELEARIEDFSTRLAAKRKERDNYIRLCARESISEAELDSYLAGLGIEAESIQLLLEDARSELAAKEHDRLAAQSAEEWLLARRDRVEEVEEDTPGLTFFGEPKKKNRSSTSSPR